MTPDGKIVPEGMPTRRPRLWRWGAFNLVGMLGFGLQLAVLFLLCSLLGIHYLVATALAVESAVLHNFFWHERWTWADRADGAPGGSLHRLLRFHLTTGAASIGGNLLLMALCVGVLEMHYLAANLITILACSALNFVATDRLVFRN